jgi:hypothetical protein
MSKISRGGLRPLLRRRAIDHTAVILARALLMTGFRNL